MSSPDSVPIKDDAVHMVRRDAAADQRFKLLNELLDESSEGALGKTQHRVNNLGQIASMTMPPGFEKGRQSGGTFANNSFREYHQAETPEVKFYFEYRGSRMTAASANRFRQTLAQKAHELTNSELENLQEVLGAKRSSKDDFQINSARTEDLNGKRVLTVEGRYPRYHLSARTIFVDSDGSGSAVQEISFQSTTAEFAEKTALSRKVFNSIKWK